MNLASRNYQEKRNFIRMKVDTPVTLTSDGSDAPIKGQCLNLSGGGMLIETSTALPVGCQLEVSLASTHGHSPMLKARAEVRRILSGPTLAEAPCKAGLEILEMIE